MDPLTLIVAALAAGAGAAGKAAVSEAVKDAYGKLKHRLGKSAAASQDARDALSKVEQRPDSEGRRAVLREELQHLAAERDSELVDMAVALVALLKREKDLPDHVLVLIQTGSGAIAQGPDAKAVGAGGALIAGNFKGNLYIGSPPVDHARILAVYRQCVAATCSHLPLRGVDLGASDPTAAQKQLDLDRVYIGLDTTMQVEKEPGRKPRRRREAEMPGRGETRPLAALEAAGQNHRVVILGDPGSGKSTFLSHLSLCLAQHGLEPAADWATRLDGWAAAEADLIPIPVVLRDFARTIPAKPDPAAPCLLWQFIVERLQKQNLGFAENALFEALEEGRALVLLDGLDEVSSPEQRAFVRNAVLKFADRHRASRMIVTCRTLSYQDHRWQLPEDAFPAFTLAPFDEEKIDRFIAAWFNDLQHLGTIKPDDAPTLTRSLQIAIRRPDMWRLAPNPLLLTVMALVHTHKGRLPDARALLYEDTVDLLLWRWEQIKDAGETDKPGLRQLLVQTGRSDVDLKRTLWRLAFDAHRAGGSDPDKLADIGELALQNALAALHPDGCRNWAAQTIETIKQRAGLLLERAPQVYTFPHRTFQEYLAGAHLASQANFASESSALVASGGFWREVILLAVGKLVYLHGEIEKPLILAATLCPENSEAGDLVWRNAWLAGDVLNETGLARVGESRLGRDLLPRVKKRIALLLEAGALSPVERAAAGVTLGRLGDPRKGVGVTADGLPDIDWIEVPSGPFVMGNKKNTYEWAKETPQFDCRLIHRPYRIGRHPVTVVQFDCFVKAQGYEQKTYWTDAGWRWLQKEGKSAPDEYAEAFQTRNHPRVGISWYEAVAFCNWLSEKTGLEIALPTEAQWERAARHTDGRVYPWGNEEECNARCNMGETGIGHSSAVGIFPTGNAECGAADMAGNVWEWCRTQWCEDYKDYERKVDDSLEGTGARVLRGGAFSFVTVDVRCACCLRLGPGGRFGGVGFRVVASPSVSDSEL